MKIKYILPGILGISLAISCATGPVGGLVYTNTQFAGELNPANDVPEEKTGTECQHNVLTLFTFGDTGAGSIAKENGIKRIATIDHSFMNVLYIYRQYCTVVRGK